jgi:hypothetical protein
MIAFPTGVLAKAQSGQSLTFTLHFCKSRAKTVPRRRWGYSNVYLYPRWAYFTQSLGLEEAGTSANNTGDGSDQATAFEKNMSVTFYRNGASRARQETAR